jgi:hypothetical protein
MPITDPDALAAIVESYDGTVIPGRTFRFDLPMSKVREAISKISQASGLRVEKVPGGERSETGDGYDRVQTVVTLELRRHPERTEYQDERNLMRAIIR